MLQLLGDSDNHDPEMTRATLELLESSGATGKVLTHYGTGVILYDHNPISDRPCVLASSPSRRWPSATTELGSGRPTEASSSSSSNPIQCDPTDGE